MGLEKDLKVGDQIFGFTFPSGKGGGPPGFISNGVIDTSFQVKRVTQAKKKRLLRKSKKTTTINYYQFEFRWLPWVFGKINYANLEGKDILSGMFTGCWMCIYREGNYRVGHIATQADASDCKQLWRDHVAGPDVFGAKQFLPHRGLSGTTNLGLVTSTCEFYQIQLRDDKNVTIDNPYATAEEWLASGRVSDPQLAEYLASQTEVTANQAYAGSAYQVLKITGPVGDEAFPA